MLFKDRAIRSLGSLFALMTSCAFAQDYDLSVLPSYKAAQNQLGVIRVHGSQLTVNLIHRWEQDFLQLHPDIRCRENILPSWFSGLCAGTEEKAGRPVGVAPNGDPVQPKIDPKVKEFLRYVLSRQGQQDVVREGDFLPLTAKTVGEQLKKLDE
jgi:ABC-type phosphate transport system substrate-binding protein